MLIEEITVNEFIKSWYKKDTSKYTEAQAEQCYCEYMDCSGLYKSKHFQQLSYINYLGIRVSSMKIAIQAQKDMVETLGFPFEEGFTFFSRYGHKLFWQDDKKQFLEYLLKIERKERKYETDLNQKQKTFIEEQKKSIPQQKSIAQSRAEFIKMIITLQKNGYVIDRNTTVVEELCIMVKESIEEQNKPK